MKKVYITPQVIAIMVEPNLMSSGSPTQLKDEDAVAPGMSRDYDWDD